MAAQNGDHRSGNQGYGMVKSETRREAETLIQIHGRARDGRDSKIIRARDRRDRP